MDFKVEFKNVVKAFPMHAKQSEKLLKLFFGNKKQTKEFLAVKNATFKVEPGKTVGIAGLNGSGKSTISNMLAKIIQPTEGEIIINGEPSLIAISAGLNNNLSGLENIELKCMMHGLSKRQILERKEDIIEFADIGEYIFQPVKNYSSGMRSRLGFAISVHTDPDILIIDEALSVGDTTFAQKCLDKLNEFKAEGKTIFFISHSAGQMKTFCDEVIWIHYGEIIEQGEAAEIVKKYQDFTKWFNEISRKEKRIYKQKMLENQYRIHKSNSKENRTKYINRENIKVISSIIPVIILGVLLLMGY
ncbi:ABC transporter ATP-binding protein [Gracilibacillus dipsosauri]|uniref:ABC transporter ATP-binding protein n=1 Tax=Gracilibacillus dipsosauri TaxID=178340 RepID=UPI002409BF99